MARPQVVFFGSGPVAAASLKLLSEHCDIEAVVTKPTTSREMSAACSSPVYTVASKAELDELIKNDPFISRLAVLIDFGIIVSQDVIDYFPLGIINSHFSLLPEWRGADPITFALLSGQNKTGVSLMLLTAGMDEGPIFASAALEISDQDNHSLTAELIDLSDALLRESLPLIVEGAILPQTQEANAALHTIDPKPSYSRKLTKADGVLNWTKPADQLEREIRAYSTWPRSRTQLAGKDVIITAAHIVDTASEPGKLHATKDSLVIGCGQQALSIVSLQPAGKKEMPIRAFLAGNTLTN